MSLFALLSVSAGCGGGDDPKTATTETDAHGCQAAEQPQPRSIELTAPRKQLDAKKSYEVTFATNCGEFKVALDVKNNPKTSSSFAHIVEEGAYNGTWFHRIVPDFVVQGGDPKADGTGGVGYSVVEPPTGKYRIGTVAMAKAGSEPSGASSSQFYIVIGESGTDLPPDYAIAGKVSDGMDVVEKIAEYVPPENTPGDMPQDVALIQRATLAVSP